MKTFDVQSIEIKAPFVRSFEYIADPDNLPEWTEAFRAIGDGKAEMHTEKGSVTVDLLVTASREFGTVDWAMTFPDRAVATASSRLVENGLGSCVYSFVLKAPALPLEQLEGALEAQSRILRKELERLREILEASSISEA
jgi:polyketide cyclase/dehydrase/lipid transport protein